MATGATILQLKSPRDVVAEIVRDIRTAGTGIVPLVGSGLSVESGIPSGASLEPYLDMVMYECLHRGWDLRAMGWPSLHRESPLLSKSIETRRRAPTARAVSAETEELEKEGVAALKDWRSSVFYLSRLGGWRDSIRLLAPDHRVIDSLADLLTWGAQPSAAHRTLALAARAMRISTILTTNFDTLIERAFEDARMPLQAFDIPAHGALPMVERVLAQPSILKLHGSRISVRADFSLDERPSDEDREAFASYLMGHGPPRRYGSFGRNPTSRLRKDPRTTRKHLLIMGFGGSDARILELIAFALRHTTQKVFWIAHRQAEVDAIRDSLRWLDEALEVESIGKSTASADTHRAASCITVESAQLFLQELYDSLTGTIPARGINYNFTTYVAPPPLTSHSDAAVADICHLLWHSQLPSRTTSALPHVITLKGDRGVSSVAAAVYWTLVDQPRLPGCRDLTTGIGDSPLPRPAHAKPFDCLWFELSHFSGPGDFLAELLRQLVLRTGRLGAEHVSIDPDMKPQEAVDLLKHLGISHRHWAIFLYGRGVPGSDSGYHLPREADREDTDGQSSFWTEQEYVAFHAIIKHLEPVLWIVHMPFDAGRKAYLRAEGRPEDLAITEPDMDGVLTKDIANVAIAKAHTLVTDAIEWCHRDELPAGYQGPPLSGEEIISRKRAFLYALTLCRRPRHRFVLHSVGLFRCLRRFNIVASDNDESRVLFVDDWLRYFETRGLLRIRPGGSVWMNRDIRKKLKAVMDADDHQGSLPLHRHSARTHMLIAHAFEQAFFATNSSTEALEALHHLDLAIRDIPAAGSKQGDAASDRVYRTQLLSVCLLRSIKLLRASRDTMRRETDAKTVQELCDSAHRRSAFYASLSDLDANERTRVQQWTVMLTREWRRALRSLRPGQDLGVDVDFSDVEDTDSVQRESVADARRAVVRSGKRRIDARILSQDSHQHPDAVLALRDAAGCIDPALGTVTELWDPTATATFTVEESLRRRHSLLLRLRSWLARRGESLAARDIQVEGLATIVRELCVVRLRQLQELHLRCWSIDDTDSVDRKDGSVKWAKVKMEDERDRPRAVEVCLLCGVAIELAVQLGPDARDAEELTLVVAESSYGLALAYLARFSEAHRRLSNAFARLSRSKNERREERWAILELSRGAVNLRQAQWFCMEHGERDEKQVRHALALLDDSWAALQRARQSLSGKSRSTRWWGELYVLELRTLSMYAQVESDAHHADESLPSGSVRFRRLVGLPDRSPSRRLDRTAEVLKAEQLLRPRDTLRHAQVMHSAALVLAWEAKRETETETETRREALEYLKTTLREYIGTADSQNDCAASTDATNTFYQEVRQVADCALKAANLTSDELP